MVNMLICEGNEAQLLRHFTRHYLERPALMANMPFINIYIKGTSIVPCDFIGFRAGSAHSLPEHHDALLANMLAQSQAMMWGRNLDQKLTRFLIEQGKTELQAEDS